MQVYEQKMKNVYARMNGKKQQETKQQNSRVNKKRHSNGFILKKRQ